MISTLSLLTLFAHPAAATTINGTPSDSKKCVRIIVTNIGGQRSVCVTGLIDQGDSDGAEIHPYFNMVGSVLTMGLPESVSEAGLVASFNLYGVTNTGSPQMEITGATAGDRAGSSVALIGAASASDMERVAVGAEGLGMVYLIDGSPVTSGSITAHNDNKLYGAWGSNFGAELSSVGDMDGDGFADLLIGGDNVAHLLYGPLDSTVVVSSATSMTLTGGVELGTDLAGVGDVNGDGLRDMVVADPGYDSDRGAAYVFLGDAALSIGAVSITTADAIWTGEATGHRAGHAIAPVGDTNDDGYDDWVIGAPEADWGGTDSGTVYVVLGAASPIGTRSLYGAGAIIDGLSAGDGLGSALAGGDINGDDKAEVFIGAPGRDADSGAVFIVPGGANGFVNLSTAADEAVGNIGARLGSAVGSVDIDSDGNVDPVMLDLDGNLLIWAY